MPEGVPKFARISGYLGKVGMAVDDGASGFAACKHAALSIFAKMKS
jgi:hypothetical protein